MTRKSTYLLNSVLNWKRKPDASDKQFNDRDEAVLKEECHNMSWVASHTRRWCSFSKALNALPVLPHHGILSEGLASRVHKRVFLLVLMQFTTAPPAGGAKVLCPPTPPPQFAGKSTIACTRVRMLGQSEQPASSAHASLPLLSRLRQALSAGLYTQKRCCSSAAVSLCHRNQTSSLHCIKVSSVPWCAWIIFNSRLWVCAALHFLHQSFCLTKKLAITNSLMVFLEAHVVCYRSPDGSNATGLSKPSC